MSGYIIETEHFVGCHVEKMAEGPQLDVRDKASALFDSEYGQIIEIIAI